MGEAQVKSSAASQHVKMGAGAADLQASVQWKILAAYRALHYHATTSLTRRASVSACIDSDPLRPLGTSRYDD